MEETEKAIPWRDEELAAKNAQIAYWQGNYEIMVRVLATMRPDDPCVKWLDEIVHTRFSKLL